MWIATLPGVLGDAIALRDAAVFAAAGLSIAALLPAFVTGTGTAKIATATATVQLEVDTDKGHSLGTSAAQRRGSVAKMPWQVLTAG